MSEPGPIAQAFGRIAYEFTLLQPILPTYAHVILAAIFPIYIASHASLSRPSSAAKPVKKERADGDNADEEDDEDDFQRMEGLSPTDALLFPLLAGVTLSGLYFLIKWLQDPELLNRILNWYFAIVGLYGVCKFISDAFHIVHLFVFPSYYSDGVNVWHVHHSTRKTSRITGEGEMSVRTTPLPGLLAFIPLPPKPCGLLWTIRGLPSKKLTIKFYLHRIVALRTHIDLYGALGICLGTTAVAYFNLVSKPWYLTNLMGFAFSYSALQLMSPTTFGTGTLVLCGLFIYDIYMVFFTPMMVTVAKSLDIPIKLVFPRPTPAGADPTKPQFAMLGLGDIVLPGMVMGLALRFDLYLHYLRKQKTVKSEAENGAESKVVKAEYVSPSKHWSNHFWTTSRFGFRSLNSDKINDGQFSKTYFNASLVGYLVGMLTTLGAMQWSDHPQPALLYLVPGVLLFLWVTALVRGDLKLMWEFTEVEEEEVDVGADDNGKKKDASKKKSIFSEEAQLKQEAALKRVAERVIQQCDSDSEEYETEKAKGQLGNKSQAKVEKLEHAFHRDKQQDLIFFSVSSYRPFKRANSKKQEDAEPKWVAPVKVHSNGEPAEKRLRTA